VGGRPFVADRHLTRLRQSAAIIGLDISAVDTSLRTALDDTAAHWHRRHPHTDARLRLTVTAGSGAPGPVRSAAMPTVVVSAGPLAPTPPTATVVTSQWVRNERAPSAGAKTTSYVDNVVARLAAARAGADEALMANTVGMLCEATSANVFVVLDGELLTPPLTSGCLGGVTRELIIESGCGAREHDIHATDVPRATEMFLTSTTRGVQAVTRVDTVTLPSPVPGPHTMAAAAALAAAHLDHRAH
jgi:branched-chain amino acid aminotransferase